MQLDTEETKESFLYMEHNRNIAPEGRIAARNSASNRLRSRHYVYRGTSPGRWRDDANTKQAATTSVLRS